MGQLSLFGLMGDEYQDIAYEKESNDWKWSMANDYPPHDSGLKVFSCFACGGGLRWVTS